MELIEITGCIDNKKYEVGVLMIHIWEFVEIIYELKEEKWERVHFTSAYSFSDTVILLFCFLLCFPVFLVLLQLELDLVCTFFASCLFCFLHLGFFVWTPALLLKLAFCFFQLTCLLSVLHLGPYNFCYTQVWAGFSLYKWKRLMFPSLLHIYSP